MTLISSLYLHSRSQAPPLRLGVLVDGFRLPRALRHVLTDIVSSDFVRLELLVVNRQTPPPSRRRFRYLHPLLSSRSRRLLLYHTYTRLDERNALNPNPLEEVDCTEILETIPRLDVAPLTRRFVHRFPPEAIAAVRACDLDVLLRFGFNILRGDILTTARYGIWSFHHGDNEFYRGGPALFWELVEDNPCSGVVLQLLTERLDDGLVLCKSLFSTMRGFSRHRNVFAPYWGSTHFVIRKLHELHERGWDSVNRNAVTPAAYKGKRAIYRHPTNSEMVKWIASELGHHLLNRVRRRGTIPHWRICLRRADSPRLLMEPGAPWYDYRWVPNPPGHFYADPFLLEHKREAWLFFEDYSYAEHRGRIACVRIDSDLSVRPIMPCLSLPYHLSYPFVFHHDGEVFLIPEAERNETVNLYRATDFPVSWKLEKTLFRGRAVDTTALHHEGRWYFFTTLCEPSNSAVFAALFSADELTGDWELHPDSPISTDVRHARSAGAVQALAGRFLRPVQDCSENYGRRVNVHEILELTESSFRERHMLSIHPDWENDLKGVHTYAFCCGIEALDAMTLEAWRSKAAGAG
jgi:hypothetical protein